MEGRRGHGGHAGRGGVVGWRVGARARGWGRGEPNRERHRVADRGRGAAGVGQSRPGTPGRSWCWGPRSAVGPAPRSAGTNPAKHHPRGRALVEAGGVPLRTLAAEPDRDGPRRMDTGGAGGAGHRGSVARVPGGRGPARGRPGGPWAAAGEGGRGRAGRAQGRTPRGPRWLGEGSRGRPFLRRRGGGGGWLPAWGTTGAPLERGGGGRVLPGVGPCGFMAARHGTISPTLCAGVPLWGGREGGGCWPLWCAPTHVGGGCRWEPRPAWPKKTRWRPLGSWAPTRKKLGFAGGDSARWYGLVWYGMVWYGMVWYGMVWYGM